MDRVAPKARLICCLLEIFQSRNDKLREDWIKVYEARLVRQELKKCYLGEGVNHHQECKHLVDMYSELLKDARVCQTVLGSTHD